jgi:cell division inhibitor SepF
MSVFRKAAEFLGLVDDETQDYPLDDGYLEDSEYGTDVEYLDEPAAGRARPGRGRAGEMHERGERGERIESSSGAVTVVRPSGPLQPAPVQAANTRAMPTPTPAVRPIPTTPQQVHVFEPRSFNDAQEIGDRVKAGQPVIVNLQANDRELQRRLIDFASGLCYALNGTMSKVADHVFLLTPLDVDVSDDEVERLSARGLYRAR